MKNLSNAADKGYELYTVYKIEIWRRPFLQAVPAYQEKFHALQLVVAAYLEYLYIVGDASEIGAENASANKHLLQS